MTRCDCAGDVPPPAASQHCQPVSSWGGQFSSASGECGVKRRLCRRAGLAPLGTLLALAAPLGPLHEPLGTLRSHHSLGKDAQKHTAGREQLQEQGWCSALSSASTAPSFPSESSVSSSYLLPANLSGHTSPI